MSVNSRTQFNQRGLHGILICSASGAVWFLTELNCNKYMLLGHPLWHIGMSTGISYIVKFCNEETKYIKQSKYIQKYQKKLKAILAHNA